MRGVCESHTSVNALCVRFEATSGFLREVGNRPLLCRRHFDVAAGAPSAPGGIRSRVADMALLYGAGPTVPVFCPALPRLAQKVENVYFPTLQARIELKEESTARWRAIRKGT